MEKKLFIISMFLILLNFSACGPDPFENQQLSGQAVHQPSKVADCKNIYDPVCATPPMPVCNDPKLSCLSVMPDPKTYSNKCKMLLDKAYFLHKGKCKDQNIEPPCHANYLPVCGQYMLPPCPKGALCPTLMPNPQTFGNICLLEQSGAEFLYDGECLDEEVGPSCHPNYMPVCGQYILPPCSEDEICPTLMPNPQTFDNRCLLDQAGAEYLYEGACKD